jgi:hypothetical protein
VRALDGPFVVQFRQGLDMTVSTGTLGNRRLYATAGVYFGWRVTHELSVGLEAFEAYAIQVPNVSDADREAIIASPHVRVTLPWVQPVVSLFTNVGPPLYGNCAAVWGFRVALTLLYDQSAALRLRMEQR